MNMLSKCVSQEVIRNQNGNNMFLMLLASFAACINLLGRP